MCMKWLTFYIGIFPCVHLVNTILGDLCVLSACCHKIAQSALWPPLKCAGLPSLHFTPHWQLHPCLSVLIVS
jgi:hypothetical protein